MPTDYQWEENSELLPAAICYPESPDNCYETGCLNPGRKERRKKKKSKQAFAVAVKVAPRCQTVDACQSTENKVLQLSYLIDHAALSELLLSHFYITALI